MRRRYLDYSSGLYRTFPGRAFQWAANKRDRRRVGLALAVSARNSDCVCSAVRFARTE